MHMILHCFQVATGRMHGLLLLHLKLQQSTITKGKKEQIRQFKTETTDKDTLRREEFTIRHCRRLWKQQCLSAGSPQGA